MIDNGITAGERLCNFVNHRLLQCPAWGELQLTLDSTGRSDELILFFREVAAVTLTGRIVTAGVTINDTDPIADVAFRRLFTEYLRDVVGIPGRLLSEISRVSYRAVEAALQPISPSLQRRMRDWANMRHQRCYMCGCALDFENADPITEYTLEHIWPRSYGGDSIEDNLLPACKSCNSRKKTNFATWAMPAIQSLLLGIAPEEQRLDEIPGSFKFALHYRAAQELARRKRSTLKAAFLEIGPWTSIRVVDSDDVADFFNLENHELV